jgi:uncharacterized protein YdeI (YjbR/CyaY-like superfamily)
VDRPEVEVRSRAEWRAWLEANHAQTTSVWLVTAKRGRPHHVEYNDLVEEALCFGWIDGQVRTVDEDRGAITMSPRRSGSGWAATNKARIERLTAAGLMAPAGLAVIEAAKQAGTWTLFDDVEKLIEPDDLVAALDAVPAARTNWDGFPPSARKMALTWLVTAKRPETRARRIATIAAEAAEGRRTP